MPGNDDDVTRIKKGKEAMAMMMVKVIVGRNSQ